MAVTVSIPTILRTHTGGEKTVEAKGSTVAEVIDDLEARHPGIAGRLVNNGKLHRFVNIYVDDEDIRFSGGLEAPVGENSTFTILPAVAGGASDSSAAPLAIGSVRTRVAGGASDPSAAAVAHSSTGPCGAGGSGG
jgi:molybdopterin synthase sulfur carrier subunit